MKKSPLIVFTGLAVAAIGGVLGITSGRWMGETPVTTTVQTSAGGETITKTDEPAANTTTTVEQTPAASESAATEQAATSAAENTPATETNTSETAAATPEETPAAASTEAAPVAAAGATQETTEVASNTPTETPEVTSEAPTKPSFDTVRVEKTGEAVIAGTAEAGSEVVVMLDGETIGTATANADGAFVIVPEKALPQGSGALTIEAKGANETTAVKSDQSVAVIVPAAEEKKEALVAVITPDQPTKVLQKPLADIGKSAVSLDAVDYDGSGSIVFNGRAAPGTVVRLYVDNLVAGDAAADGEGRWAFSGGTAMAPGNHMLRVDAIDNAGKVLGRIELPFVRESQAKIASAAETTAAEPVTEATGQAATTTTSATTTTTVATTETAPKKGRIVIQPGNNLWRISKVIYGDGKKYSMIYDANKDLIRDPDMIFPGQIFDTPEVVPPEKIDPALREQVQTSP